MALTRPERYNIEDSNIALLGSDVSVFALDSLKERWNLTHPGRQLEKHVREHGGDKEPAWEDAGKEPGIQVWRIENFHVTPLPEKQHGLFYDGDSYIVLHVSMAYHALSTQERFHLYFRKVDLQ